MSLDVLQELEISAPVAENLETVEDHLRKAMRALNLLVKDLKGSAVKFEGAWRHIIMDVAKGQTAQMQSQRPGLLRLFEEHLEMLNNAHSVATIYHRLGREDVPDPAVLSSEIKDMERFKAKVLDLWNTTEDLERLAVEYYPLSRERLKRIAAANPPPPEWFQGEDEEFF